MDKKNSQSTEKHLAKYQELVGKRKTLQARLERINAEKGSVKEAIYEKVRGEYEKQLGELENEIQPVKDEVDKTRRMIKDQLARIDEEVAALEDQLQEFDLRHRVGEFDENELSKLRDPVHRQSDELSERRKHLAQTHQQLDDPDAAPPAETTRTAAGEAPTPDAAEPVSKVPPPGPVTRPRPPAPVTAKGKPPAPDTGEPAAPTVPRKAPAPSPQPTAAAAPPQPPEAPEAPTVDAPEIPAASPPPAEPDDGLVLSGAKPSKRVNKMQGLVDTSEWSKEFQEETHKGGKGRRHTDTPDAPTAATDDDPLAALSDSSAPAGPAATTRGKKRGGVGTREKPRGFPVLIITKGPGAGKKLPLVPMTMTIGREHDNNIELKDEEVSRYHARISYESGEYVIKDLDSSSGTWVNEERIAEAALNQGDRIQVGATELVIDFE
ncbi:MAG: FHA domain-containing protein [Candidatus Krumholzibacteriia bacterium]